MIGLFLVVLVIGVLIFRERNKYYDGYNWVKYYKINKNHLYFTYEPNKSIPQKYKIVRIINVQWGEITVKILYDNIDNIKNNAIKIIPVIWWQGNYIDYNKWTTKFGLPEFYRVFGKEHLKPENK